MGIGRETLTRIRWHWTRWIPVNPIPMHTSNYTHPLKTYSFFQQCWLLTPLCHECSRFVNPANGRCSAWYSFTVSAAFGLCHIRTQNWRDNATFTRCGSLRCRVVLCGAVRICAVSQYVAECRTMPHHAA